jgi:hypothetical protein
MYQIISLLIADFEALFIFLFFGGLEEKFKGGGNVRVYQGSL